MGFESLEISEVSIPIGAWSESISETCDEFLPGKKAFSSFLKYVESSRLLLEEIPKSEINTFIEGVKGELENFGNATIDFLEVKVYVS